MMDLVAAYCLEKSTFGRGLQRASWKRPVRLLKNRTSAARLRHRVSVSVILRGNRNALLTVSASYKAPKFSRLSTNTTNMFFLCVCDYWCAMFSAAFCMLWHCTRRCKAIPNNKEVRRGRKMESALCGALTTLLEGKGRRLIHFGNELLYI